MARNQVRSNIKSFTREQWAAMDTRTAQEKEISAKRMADMKNKKNLKDHPPQPMPPVKVKP